MLGTNPSCTAEEAKTMINIEHGQLWAARPSAGQGARPGNEPGPPGADGCISAARGLNASVPPPGEAITDVAIEATGLTKSFGPTKALAGVDLAARRGTVLGVLGPNGAGKTTAVRILATLLRADEGTARINGFDVRTQPEKVRESIGLTGQFASVDDDLTGTQNLVMIGQLLDLPRKAARTRAVELLEWFDLTEAASKQVKTYSGGMRRRLDLAASLVGKPSVIFLDEPTTGLDPAKREDMWDVVRDLVSDGSTVLLTTQYLEEADALADEITVIDHGRVIAHDTPHGLKRVIGGQRLTVHPIDPARYDDLVTVLDEIARTHWRAPEADGRGSVTIQVDSDEVLPDVVTRVRAAGIAVDEFSLHLPSLDEVFFTLTGTRSRGSDTAEEISS
jgi:oleandomycin transport system ATP-binding protein